MYLGRCSLLSLHIERSRSYYKMAPQMVRLKYLSERTACRLRVQAAGLMIVQRMSCLDGRSQRICTHSLLVALFEYTSTRRQGTIRGCIWYHSPALSELIVYGQARCRPLSPAFALRGDVAAPPRRAKRALFRGPCKPELPGHHSPWVTAIAQLKLRLDGERSGRFQS